MELQVFNILRHQKWKFFELLWSWRDSNYSLNSTARADFCFN